MILRHKFVVAVSGLIWTAMRPFAASLQPQIVAGINLDEIVISANRDASPVFLADDSIGLLVRSGRPQSGDSKVVVLQLAGGKLHLVASTRKANESDQIYAASDRRLVIAAGGHSDLYSSDLRETLEIPVRQRPLLRSFFPRSSTIGESDLHDWTVFRLAHEMPTIRKGSGQLLSVSDDVVVFRLDDAIRIETQDGRLLGSIPVPPNTKGAPIAEIAGRGRLFLDFSGKTRIVDFNGKEIASIHRPYGWGFRHGWSADGARVLFDHYTRAASLAQRAIDAFGSIFVPVPEEDNGETVRVIDTATGAVCFSMESKGRLFGPSGQYHADLSPSGRLVGVATQTELTVYSLPEKCTGN
jgi:hypothetical protein